MAGWVGPRLRVHLSALRPDFFVYILTILGLNPSVPVLMATLGSFRSFLVRTRGTVFSNGSRSVRIRRAATAATDSPTLPLAGIRVLDMTRVLAGVYTSFLQPRRQSKADLAPAVLYPNPGRSWVGCSLQYDASPIARITNQLWIARSGLTLACTKCRSHQDRASSQRRRYESLGPTICEAHSWQRNGWPRGERLLSICKQETH